ncbi:hypothetical protein CCACVL1_05005, partial [Corchorus capsularis]
DGSKSGSFGAVGRDHEGLVMGSLAGRLSYVPDAFNAEAQAAVMAIKWARDMGFQ